MNVIDVGSGTGVGVWVDCQGVGLTIRPLESVIDARLWREWSEILTFVC